MEQTNPEGITPSQEQNQGQVQNQSQSQGGDYQQPPQYQQPRETNPVTLGDWVVALIITAIPLVNVVMLFVWGFSDNTKASKANWAKAMLIFMGIGIVLYLIIFIAIGAAVGTAATF